MGGGSTSNKRKIEHYQNSIKNLTDKEVDNEKNDTCNTTTIWNAKRQKRINAECVIASKEALKRNNNEKNKKDLRKAIEKQKNYNTPGEKILKKLFQK